MKIPLSSIGSALPGHLSPDAGFEAPFDMLTACHERVHRMLRLLDRLQQHLADRGWDSQAADAARDVMRYFDQAAPLHHEDEELHVFPPLLAGGDAALTDLVRQLQRDHVLMAERWAAARVGLQALADGAVQAFTPQHETALDRFAQCYDDHLRHEDDRIYPAARALLDDPAQQSMGQEMARRRGVR